MVESRWAIAITVLPFTQVRQLSLDGRFDLRIERRGRLVEDQDRRILQDHPRDRDPLALPARQLDPPLADMGVEAGAAPQVGEVGD